MSDYEITESDARALQKAVNFIEGFKIEGDGVKARKSGDSLQVQVSWPPRQFIPGPPQQVWIKITSPMPAASLGSPNVGGGGYYNARTIAGLPVTIDPTLDFDIPAFPNEVVATTDNILAENCLEASLGDPASHWITDLPALGVPAWRVGTSNETPPRPVYRFMYPEPARLYTLKITDYFGGSGGTGGARYKAVLLTGKSDGTVSATGNLSLPDSGETVGTTTVCYESDPENGITQSHILPVGAFVEGRFAGWGKDSGANPIQLYRGTGLPIGMFPCKVKKDGGVAGDFKTSTDCSWTYSIFYADDNGTGNRPIYLGTTLTPDASRVGRCKYNQPGDYSPGIAYYIPGSSTPHLYSVAQEIPTTAVLAALTSFQINASGTDYKYQYKKTQSVVLDIGNEDSSWTDVITGEEC